MKATRNTNLRKTRPILVQGVLIKVIDVVETPRRKEHATIRRLGFGTFLHLMLNSVAKRDLLRWLLDNDKLEIGKIIN